MQQQRQHASSTTSCDEAAKAYGMHTIQAKLLQHQPPGQDSGSICIACQDAQGPRMLPGQVPWHEAAATQSTSYCTGAEDVDVVRLLILHISACHGGGCRHGGWLHGRVPAPLQAARSTGTGTSTDTAWGQAARASAASQLQHAAANCRASNRHHPRNVHPIREPTDQVQSLTG